MKENNMTTQQLNSQNKRLQRIAKELAEIADSNSLYPRREHVLFTAALAIRQLAGSNSRDAVETLRSTRDDLQTEIPRYPVTRADGKIVFVTVPPSNQ